jgi:uncharacterized protein (TIGR02588 family)
VPKAQPLTARTPLLEWIASGIGLVLTVAVLVVIGRQAISGGAAEVPDIEVGVSRIVPVSAGFVVEIVARNHSGGTAAAVEIEGSLGPGGAVETSGATFDYVPGHSERKGGLFFSEDPRRHMLEVRALGYKTP